MVTLPNVQTTAARIKVEAIGNIFFDISDANFTIAGTAPPASLDVDASSPTSKYDALTDGLLVLRYLFGLTGPALTNGALGPGATRTDPADIKAYLDAMRSSLDIDGNGTVDALTDGLLVLRYMFGVRGSALVSGALGPLPSRMAPADIETYILSLMP